MRIAVIKQSKIKKQSWYYKLQANEPIFPTATDSNKKSRILIGVIFTPIRFSFVQSSITFSS